MPRKHPFQLAEKIQFPKQSAQGFPLSLLLDTYLKNLIPVTPIHAEMVEFLFSRIGFEQARELMCRFAVSRFDRDLLEKLENSEDIRDLLSCMSQMSHSERLYRYEKDLRKYFVFAIRSYGEPNGHRPIDYFKKLKCVGGGMGLSFEELEILEVAICYEVSRDFMNYCDQYITSDWPYLISQALNQSPELIQKRIGGSQGLVQKGLLEFSMNSIDVYEPVLHYLIGIRSDFLDPDTCTRVEPSPYPLESFPVPHDELELIQRTLTSKGPGHLLFYGRPGTGKTEIAKALAHQGGYDPLLVSCGKDGSPQQRMVAMTAALSMASERTLLILDECDTLLNSLGGFLKPAVDKGWVNHFLDTCPHKVIWITNDVGDIPASVLRRFAYSLPFDKFTIDQRRCTWEEQLRQMKMTPWLTSGAVKRLSRNYQTDAGAIASAVNVTRNLYGEHPPESPETEATLQRLLKHHLRLSGFQEAGIPSRRVPIAYDSEALHTDVAPDRLLKTLIDYTARLASGESMPSAALLFWGLPGTGKTQLAIHLAEELECPLIQKRMSDLQSKYVGETEQQIAAAFREARTQQGILLLDEADSLFLDRTTAQRSWEASQTNEVLTQLESFEGICICCTNLLDHLDRAALRRFTWKVEFKPLRPEGRLRLYRRYFQPKGRLADIVHTRLHQMPQLTPGDFKVVGQQMALRTVAPNRDEILDALDQEQSYKSTRMSEPIGFGRGAVNQASKEPVFT